MIFETVFSEVIPRTRYVRSFRFDRANDFAYNAGQFIYVTIEMSGKKMTKHFTISSSPSENYLEFTKRLTDSDYSKALETVEKGTWVGIDGPYGSFTLDPDQKKIAMLCGGIGITPFRSMIKFLFDHSLDNEIMLLYSCGTYNDIVFREELNEMAQRKKKLSVFYTLTREGDWWEGERGRIDGEKVRRLIQDYEERLYYVCGPNIMVESVITVLLSVGVPRNMIKKESFTGY